MAGKKKSSVKKQCGLPRAPELKHERNQTVHDAVAQYAGREHAHKIFQHPFLYLAADTSDVMAATDPRREQNFRWHNTGLSNEAISTHGSEYPVEFLSREVLAKEQLLKALSFFLIRVPRREAEDDKPIIVTPSRSLPGCWTRLRRTQN